MGWRERSSVDDIPQEIPEQLRHRIRVDLLRIHSKCLQRTDLQECLRECYDVYAKVLRDAGWQLSGPLLEQFIPAWVFRWAWTRGWLPTTWPVRAVRGNLLEGWWRTGPSVVSVPDAELRFFVQGHLRGRIRYWQAETLVAQENLKNEDDPREIAARQERESLVARAQVGQHATLEDLCHKLGVARSTLRKCRRDPRSVRPANAADIECCAGSRAEMSW